jgi:hypothetical protein
MLFLILDSALFLIFLIATAPRFSGIAWHEWLGIVFEAVIVVHVLIHWEWIVAVTRSFLGRVQGMARLNYILNVLLFVDVTLITFTGLMISQVALPLFGIQAPREGIWRIVHSLTSDAGVLLIGAHLALHWQWIVHSIQRLIGTRNVTRRAVALNQTIETPTEVRS